MTPRWAVAAGRTRVAAFGRCDCGAGTWANSGDAPSGAIFHPGRIEAQQTAGGPIHRPSQDEHRFVEETRQAVYAFCALHHAMHIFAGGHADAKAPRAVADHVENAGDTHLTARRRDLAQILGGLGDPAIENGGVEVNGVELVAKDPPDLGQAMKERAVELIAFVSSATSSIIRRTTSKAVCSGWGSVAQSSPCRYSSGAASPILGIWRVMSVLSSRWL